MVSPVLAEPDLLTTTTSLLRSMGLVCSLMPAEKSTFTIRLVTEPLG